MPSTSVIPVFTDDELRARGNATLLASWEAYARGAKGAAVVRGPGVAAGVFPAPPERDIYNNALLDGGLSPAERAVALDAMEAAYAAAGVARFAAWVHETDPAMCHDLERRGYTLDETTRAMGMALSDIRLPRPALDLAPPDWAAYRSMFDLPADLLTEHGGFRLAIARLDGERAAAALAFDLGDDCGIFNVGTVERSRRRGLATALTALLAHDARARGRRTAGLQSTIAAEGVYRAVGFRDLGRILEYVPGPPASHLVGPGAPFREVWKV